MSELSERQKNLLLIIIRDYIDSAQPVGSKRIVEHYHLDLSSATIRNEMSVLTESGLPAPAPHLCWTRSNRRRLSFFCQSDGESG